MKPKDGKHSERRHHRKGGLQARLAFSVAQRMFCPSGLEDADKSRKTKAAASETMIAWKLGMDSGKLKIH